MHAVRCVNKHTPTNTAEIFLLLFISLSLKIISSLPGNGLWFQMHRDLWQRSTAALSESLQLNYSNIFTPTMEEIWLNTAHKKPFSSWSAEKRLIWTEALDRLIVRKDILINKECPHCEQMCCEQHRASLVLLPIYFQFYLPCCKDCFWHNFITAIIGNFSVCLIVCFLLSYMTWTLENYKKKLKYNTLHFVFCLSMVCAAQLTWFKPETRDILILRHVQILKKTVVVQM